MKFLIATVSMGLFAGCGGGTGGSGSGGAGNGGGDGDSFVLGVAAPFTGDSSEFGTQIRMGVDLYADQINKAGGINGRKLELNYQDDAGKAEQAQTVATTLASDDSVLAVIGHFNSSCSLAGKGLYSAANLVLFSPASTNVDVTKDTDYVFRNIFTDDFQGQSLASYAANMLGKKNAAILYDNDDYGIGLKESFKEQAGKLGLNIATELAYNTNAPDFRSQLTTIQGLQPAPDIILIAGLYTQAANIARQARSLGIQTQLIGGDGVFSTQFITLGGEAAEGTFVSCPFLFDLGGEKATEFAEAFRAKYNQEPDAWAALSYDAISMICEGLKKNGFTREAVLEYLQGINSVETAYDGVIGKTFFDEEGDTRRPVQMAQVKGGKFVAAEKQLPIEGEGAAAPAAAAAAAGAEPAATTPEPAAAAEPAATETPEAAVTPEVTAASDTTTTPAGL
jgi:branched-chain amino acid transport system substrate-binding protein